MWCVYIHNIYINIYTIEYMYIYTIEYYSAIKKNGNLSFATAGLDLEGIMLSEINQTEKSEYCNVFTYIWNLKKTTN